MYIQNILKRGAKMIEEQSIKKAKEIYVRMFSVAVCDLFDELLDEHDITIPSDDREGEDGEARIYGDVYYDLEAKVTEVLARLCEEVKAAPDVAINVEDYNGFSDVDTSLKETSEEIFEKHVLAQLTEKGFDVSQVELEIIEFMDNDHKDCSWYGGVVAEVKYKDFLFSLEARGDIICTLFDKNENELGYVKDRNNGSSFRYEMAHCLANDAELHKAEEDGRLIYENNNWFEIFVRTPDEEWHGKTWLSESDDIEESVFVMIETMDEMIEELTEREQSMSKNNINQVIDEAKNRVQNTGNKQDLEQDIVKE